MVHLYRRQDLQPDRAVVRSTLARKCEFKGIPVPTFDALSARPERVAIEVEGEQMLAHQLPTCPPFEAFWRELPAVFDWLNTDVVLPTLPAIQLGREVLDTTWRLPPMVTAWGVGASSLETIRFAASNRLCIQLDYRKEDGERTLPTIEPYSVRRTLAGDLLLFGVKADTGGIRSYRVDRISAATVSRQAFRPRYAVELTASGPLNTPCIERPSSSSQGMASSRSPTARKSARTAVATPQRGFGLSYNFACTVCGKTFKRSTYDSTLNAHKNKQGRPCPGRVGVLKANQA